MNLKYKIKKAWFGFWQKYKLEVHLKIAGKLFLIFLVVWLIGSILTVLSQWAFIDNLEGGTPFQFKYLKYLWTVVIELVSGFDVQEDLHVVSKIISVIILITGVVIFAVFTGQIVSMFVHVLQRAHHLPEKPGNFKFKRPIIICGINEKLYKIIEELKKSDLSRDREIIIVDNEADKIRVEDKNKFKDVWYNRGDQANRKVIEKVLGEKESSAIILSQEAVGNRHTRYSDARAIETALAIEGYSEKTHTVLELNDRTHIPHLKHTKINEWISIFEYGTKLVSQAALQHGIAGLYLDLLGGAAEDKQTGGIHFSRSGLPDSIVGITYEEIRDKVLSNPFLDITLIGFAKYVDSETIERLGLDLANTFFIRQLNPRSRKCVICGSETFKVDELGRVLKKCPGCFQSEKSINRDASNRLFFPKDTIIQKNDQLIYLSHKEIDFNRLFDNETNKSPKRRKK
jgi:hypothetical protein